jgi:hypothetical protein
MTDAIHQRNAVKWLVTTGVIPLHLLSVLMTTHHAVPKKPEKMNNSDITSTDTVAIMDTTGTSQKKMVEADVATQVMTTIAVLTQLIPMTTLKENVFHPAHVKDVAISTAVMSWTSSCTKPTKITTVVLEITHHSKTTTPNGTVISMPGGMETETEKLIIIE